MNRPLTAALCCAALAVGLACGKYGRPERIAPREPVASAQAPVVEIDDAQQRDEEKSPKR